VIIWFSKKGLVCDVYACVCSFLVIFFLFLSWVFCVFFLLFFWFFVMGFSPHYIRHIISTGMVGVPKGTGNGFFKGLCMYSYFQISRIIELNHFNLFHCSVFFS
jgi:hypothetical protein